MLHTYMAHRDSYKNYQLQLQKINYTYIEYLFCILIIIKSFVLRLVILISSIIFRIRFEGRVAVVESHAPQLNGRKARQRECKDH